MATRLPRDAAIAALLIAAALLPHWLESDYLMAVIDQAALAAVLAVALNLVAGLAGQLSLGHVAFYAIGAYATALLTTRLHWDFWATVPIALIGASASGLALGSLTLRLRGHYLAVVTLAFAQIVSIVVTNWVELTRGANGIVGIPAPRLGDLAIRGDRDTYYLVLVLLAIAAYVSTRIERSYVGRALLAIREDEDAATAVGIDPFRWKLFVFVLSAALAGLAGAVFAARLRIVSPDSFTIGESITLLVMVVVGGLGSTAGAVAGAAVVVGLPEALRFLKEYEQLVFGLLLTVTVIFLPRGLRSAAPLLAARRPRRPLVAGRTP